MYTPGVYLHRGVYCAYERGLRYSIYFRYLVGKEIGYIRHYRSCRKRILEKCNNETRIVDTNVSDWSEAFRDNILTVRRNVFGS